MKWRGIRRDSIDIGTAEEGLLAINTRFTTGGELRRRRGLSRSSIERKNDGITTINGFSAFQSNVMTVLTDGDRLQGYQNPFSNWGDTPNYTAITQSGAGIFNGIITSGELVNSATVNPIPNLPITGSVVSSGIRDLRFNVSTNLANVMYFSGYTGLTTSFTEMEFDADIMDVGANVTFGWNPTIYVFKLGATYAMQANAGPSASYTMALSGVSNVRAEVSSGIIRLIVNGSQVASNSRPGAVDVNSLTISCGGTGQFHAKYFICGGS